MDLIQKPSGEVGLSCVVDISRNNSVQEIQEGVFGVLGGCSEDFVDFRERGVK